MDIKDIVRETNMSARPAYYSGRGATLTDLNSDILNKIADLIKFHYGMKAYNAYVKMVWDIEELSATSFLLNLYKLEANDWEFIASEKKNIFFENKGEALGTVLSSLFHCGRNDTELIRGSFKDWKKQQKKFKFHRDGFFIHH